MLRGLTHNTAVVVSTVGNNEDVPILAAALGDPQPLVREHSASALGSIATAEAVDALREALIAGSEP